jgi:hypothetical protein
MEASLEALGKSPYYPKHLENIAKCCKDIREDRAINIFDVLYRSQESLASEPSDKVFALLGLTYNGATIMPIPNYA